MKINDLIKHRSVTACMKEAYSLMTDNIKNLLKSTWWAFMIYAFMVAFMVFLRTPNKMLHDWGEENMMLSFCLQTVVYIGVVVAAFLMGAAVWRWLTDKPFGRMMKRFTAVYLASAVVSFVVSFAATFGLTCFYLTAFITAPESAATAGSAAATGSAAMAETAAAGSPSLLIIVLFVFAIVAAIVLCMAVSLPFAYLTPKYMLLEKGKRLHPWKSFKCGFRHMGSIFKMGFLGSLVILVAGILIYIPLAILIGAQVSAQMGTFEGDPVGTPSYFTFLFIVVTALLLFVFAYILHWLFISYIYLYGSIENDEKKKTEMQSSQC